MIRLKVAILAVAALVMGVLLVRHAPGLNGPPFFPWSWRRAPASLVYPTIALAALPLAMALLLDWLNRPLRKLAIALLMLACFSMKLAAVAVLTDPPGLGLIPATVHSPDATSYYTDAQALSSFPYSQWVPTYAQLMPRLNLHSRTKPPGPILYWMVLIRLMGDNETTALVGGLLLGAIATLAIPATYMLLKRLLDDSAAAFYGAAFLAVCPGFVLMFPAFDPVYALLSAALVGAWFSALYDDSNLWSVLAGVAMMVMCGLTFNVIAVGLFMLALVPVTGDRPLQQRFGVAMRQGGLAIATAVVLLTLIWLAAGYDPISTFTAAWRNQRELLAADPAQHPYPQAIWWDLSDFALASGWISVLLTLFCLAGPADDVQHPSHRVLVLLALGQFVAVAALGLLQNETARVWNFMLPLMMIPVGLELARWPMWARAVALASLVALTAAVHQNVGFLY